jgi:hypothetical protein
MHLTLRHFPRDLFPDNQSLTVITAHADAIVTTMHSTRVLRSACFSYGLCVRGTRAVAPPCSLIVPAILRNALYWCRLERGSPSLALVLVRLSITAIKVASVAVAARTMADAKVC